MQHFSHRPPPYPVRHESTIQAVIDHLRQGDWTRLEGAPELEADLAAFHGPDPRGRAPLPWFIASGTAALEAIMLGHGIGPGDEVITSPYTWGATVSAILAIGAIPRFADIDGDSGLITPESVAAVLSPQSKAVLAVHLFGQPVDCAGLQTLCNQRGVLFFEDASQAHGARFQGRRVGDWGDAAAFSCMGLKPLAGTEGGYALFRDRAAAECAWLYGKHPRGLDPAVAQRLGEAGLLDALQLGWRNCAISATLLRQALPHLDGENAARRANAATLRAGLANCPLVDMAEEQPGAEGIYHLLSLIWRGDADRRPAFQQALTQRGVDTFVYIPVPLHRLKRLNPQGYQGPPVLWHRQLLAAGVDYAAQDLPGAQWRSAHTLEMGFNWTVDDPRAMQSLAAAIVEAAESIA
ncbi:MAG: hypothetical protein EA402_06680 [Planctomycetota bacterium]|nr:MAG: hypothetical protein EA402_06680 [Planctomycetota bacterium]